MKHVILLLLLISRVTFSHACEYSDSTIIFRVPSPIPKEVLKSGNFTPQNLNFTFANAPTEVQEACYYAGTILESNIQFHHPINILVNWSTELSISNLGTGKAAIAYVDNNSGTSVVLPVTQYENIYNTEVNGASEIDVIVTLNANVTWWYYGLDGNTPADKTDLVTTILHEMIHSIAMVSNLKVSDDSPVNSELPTKYDKLIVDSNQDFITDTYIYPNGSSELVSAITSNNLFFKETNIVEANVNNPVKIYVPETYVAGKSLTHFDDEFRSTVNGLMTRELGRGTSIHDTGPVLNGLLKDLGWNLIATGIDDNDHEKSPGLYPNPSNEHISVSGLNDMVDLSIYNVSGERVFVEEGYSNEKRIDISFLNNGIYFVKVPLLNGKRYIVLKFLKH